MQPNTVLGGSLEFVDHTVEQDRKQSDNIKSLPQRKFLANELRRMADYVEGDFFDARIQYTVIHGVQGGWDVGSTVFLRLDVGP